MPDIYRLTDLSEGESESPAVMSPSRSGGGCFVGISTGFALVLLAMVLAVGVGIIVHFAGGGAKQVVCQCDWQAQDPPTNDAIRDQCRRMAQEGDDVICNACATQGVTSSPTGHSTTTSAITSAMTSAVTSAITSAMTSAMTSAITSTQATPINYRLPGDVIPLHYQLELQPEIYTGDPATFTFNGSVTVRVRAEADTSQIVMHSRGLNVHRDGMRLEATDSDLPPFIVNVTVAEETDFLILVLSANINRGREYLLTLTFHADLTDAGVGLFWMSYQDSGDTIYLAVTDLEPVDARSVFPSFDEPRMKATFDVTLVRRNDTSRHYQSFSNEDVMRSEDRGNGYTADVFLRSPKMSTYLLAFIVCDYDYKENILPLSRLKYRTLARPNAIQHATLVQDTGVQIFEWLESTFEPPYNLSKLDNIVIPNFPSQAMENWGLATYTERILYEEGVSTAFEMVWTMKTIAHELTHMWFGNLVSPKWWSWLWLKEGVASYFGYLILDKLHTSWKMASNALKAGDFSTESG